LSEVFALTRETLYKFMLLVFENTVLKECCDVLVFHTVFFSCLLVIIL